MIKAWDKGASEATEEYCFNLFKVCMGQGVGGIDNCHTITLQCCFIYKTVNAVSNRQAEDYGTMFRESIQVSQWYAVYIKLYATHICIYLNSYSLGEGAIWILIDSWNKPYSFIFKNCPHFFLNHMHFFSLLLLTPSGSFTGLSDYWAAPFRGSNVVLALVSVCKS